MRFFGEDSQTELSVRFSRISGTDSDDRYRVTIQDDRSMIQVLEIELDGRSVAEMLTGSERIGTARIVPSRVYHRVGRYRWNVSMEVHRNYDGEGWDGADERLSSTVESIAVLEALGAEHGNVRAVRDGIRISLLGWVETAQAAAEVGEVVASRLADYAAGQKWHVVSGAAHYPTLESLAKDARERLEG